MDREELTEFVWMLKKQAELHDPNEEILTDVKAESFIFVMDSVLSALSVPDREKGTKDCRDCVEWKTCPCGEEGHTKGTSIGYSIGECKDFKSADSEKGEWIPVSEKLPEHKQWVLVSYENEDGKDVSKGIYDKKYGFNFPNVIAWQPLPEPYKAESEDKE